MAAQIVIDDCDDRGVSMLEVETVIRQLYDRCPELRFVLACRSSHDLGVPWKACSACTRCAVPRVHSVLTGDAVMLWSPGDQAGPSDTLGGCQDVPEVMSA